MAERVLVVDDEKSIRTIVEYALKDTVRPVGVAEYRLTEALPENLRGSLPTVEELEATLDGTEV